MASLVLIGTAAFGSPNPNCVSRAWRRENSLSQNKVTVVLDSVWTNMPTDGVLRLTDTNAISLDRSHRVYVGPPPP
jgi:hypothetical protein